MLISTVKELKEFLANYSDDTEIIITDTYNNVSILGFSCGECELLNGNNTEITVELKVEF